MRRLLHVALLALTTTGAHAQLILVNPYPATGAVDIAGTSPLTKVLRVMQHHAAPSATDAVVAHLQRELTGELDTTVRVQRNSRGGGSTAVHKLKAASSQMVLFAGSGLAASNLPAALGALRPIALVAHIPTVLVTAQEGGAASVMQLLQVARETDAPLQLGTPGDRSIAHALLTSMRAHWPRGVSGVSYNGGNGVLRGILAHQVPAAVVPLPSVMPYIRGNRIRVLAIAAASPFDLLPGVPTFAEAGLPGRARGGWHGLFAAPSTPPAAIALLQAALSRIAAAPATRATLTGLGYIPIAEDAETLQSVLREAIRGMHLALRSADQSGDASRSSAGLTALNIFNSVRS